MKIKSLSRLQSEHDGLSDFILILYPKSTRKFSYEFLILCVTEMTSGTKVPHDVGDKYKTVLNALIHQNYHVMNDVYLDMFISHVSGKNGEGG